MHSGDVFFFGVTNFQENCSQTRFAAIRIYHGNDTFFVAAAAFVGVVAVSVAVVVIAKFPLCLLRSHRK